MSPGQPLSASANGLRQPWIGESFLLVVRLLALGASLGLFYLLKWHFLRSALCDSVIWALHLLGHSAVPLDSGASPTLFVGGMAVAITANCTAADLVLTLMPFCWRFQRSFESNLLRLTAVAAAVAPIPVARVALAVHFALGGIPWGLAHDAPDLILHHVTIWVAVLLALRSDRIFWKEKRGMSSFPS